MDRLKRLTRHISWVVGRRGASLVVFSFVFGLYGVLLLMARLPEETPRTVAVIFALLPAHAWGVVWIGAAVLSLVQAFLGHLRSTAWAFASLSFVSGVWASGYIAGWIVMEPPRDPRGWLTGLLWLSVFTLTIILAGWREDPRIRDGDELEVGG